MVQHGPTATKTNGNVRQHDWRFDCLISRLEGLVNTVGPEGMAAIERRSTAQESLPTRCRRAAERCNGFEMAECLHLSIWN
jgi:hypothetical protein